MSFSFIHISDIHFDAGTVSSDFFRDNNIKNKIREASLQTDCLIISGDLFNRGKLDKGQLKKCGDFLGGLPKHGLTVVVPGNHDVNRMACKKIEDSYNVFRTRKELAIEKGNEAVENSQFSLTKDDKEVLYKNAFDPFFKFSQAMGFNGFCDYDENESQLEPETYEVKIVKPIETCDQYPIQFVLLNTALIAGQTIGGQKYRERKLAWEKKANEAEANGEYVKAAKYRLEFAKLQERYENEGELTVDEEDCEDGEKGRISLSEAGLKKLSEIEAEDGMITIFVGHHGYQFLSAETKKALKQAMKNCKSGIYLCGHAHQAKYERFKIEDNSTPRDIEQIQAGIMYYDEGEYPQYGFNHGNLYIENDVPTCKITAYFLVKSASGTLQWMSETVTTRLYGIKRPTQPDNNTQEENVDERRENVVNFTERSSKEESEKQAGQDENVLTKPLSLPTQSRGPASIGNMYQNFLKNQQTEKTKKE